MRTQLRDTRGRFTSATFGPREAASVRQAASTVLRESLPELTFAFEDRGWRRFGSQTSRDLDPHELRLVMQTARLAYIAFPLIRRGVNVRSYYTWGDGVQISAADERVNDLMQEIQTNPVNQEEIFDAEAILATDADLQNTGNTYTACFTDPISGFVTLHQVDPVEIVDIVTSPDNTREAWYYKRSWTEAGTNLQSGDFRVVQRTAFYPDINYRPDNRPSMIAGHPVLWDAPIAHLKTGGLKHMKYGVPDTYAALDWARAHKGFLEDWTSLVRSLSRFAWSLTTEGDVQEAVDFLATTLGEPGAETNPAPVAGAVWTGDDGAKMEAIPKTGAAPSASDSRELRLMIAAALDLPDHILAGDVDVGNLATARTLDRPTELMVSARQRMWASYIRSILQYAIRSAIRAPQGLLTGSIQRDRVTGREIVVTDADTTVTITFPPVIEEAVEERIAAIVTAATLDGKVDAGTMPRELLITLLLSALAVENAHEVAQDVVAEVGTRPEGDLAEAVQRLAEAVGAA